MALGRHQGSVRFATLAPVWLKPDSTGEQSPRNDTTLTLPDIPKLDYGIAQDFLDVFLFNTFHLECDRP